MMRDIDIKLPADHFFKIPEKARAVDIIAQTPHQTRESKAYEDD